MPDRSLRLACAALLAATLTTGCADSGGPSATGGEIAIIPGAVQQGTAGFSPNPLILAGGEGRQVRWVNNDFTDTPATGTPHHLLSDEDLFDSGSVGPESSFAFTFPGPGTYHYRCKNHPTMHGTITIAD